MIPTFACVLRSGGDYYPEHVQVLARQVAENTTVPYRFVCYSDVKIPGVQTVPLMRDYPGWWSVPEVFRQKGPTVLTGVDTVIYNNIDQLFDIAVKSKQKDFWMIRAFHKNNDLASGIIVYNGDWSCIWDEFDYEKAVSLYRRTNRHPGGEQEHTKSVVRSKGVEPKVLQDVMGGIVSYKRHCRPNIPKRARVILFHGSPRPWEVPGLWEPKRSGHKYGEVEEIWPNSTVYILGGGPSLKDVNLGLLKGKNVLGVNQAFKISACPVPVCYSGDRRWYRWNEKALRNYGGILYTSYPRFTSDKDNVINIGRMTKYGISDKSRHSVCWNDNSGASAINVAFWLGAKRVVLLGYDMGKMGRKFNWHNDYPSKPKMDTSTGRARLPYRMYLECFDQIAQDAKRLGLEILNATPAGNLSKFPRVELKDVV